MDEEGILDGTRQREPAFSVLTWAADGKRHRKSQGHQSPANPEVNQPGTQQRTSFIKESFRNKRRGSIKQSF